MISCCTAENSPRKSQNGSTMQNGSTIQNQNYHDKLKINVVYIDQELADTITREPDFSKYQKTNGTMINTLSDVKDTDNSGIVDANAQYQKGIKSFRVMCRTNLYPVENGVCSIPLTEYGLENPSDFNNKRNEVTPLIIGLALQVIN